MEMKTAHKMTHYLLIAGSVYGIIIAITAIIVSLLGGKIVGVTTSTYATFPGNLIISTPAPLENLPPHTPILTNSAEPLIGTYISHSLVDDYNLVTIQTGYEENIINSYATTDTAQKIVLQVPLLGFGVGILTQNWQNILLFIALVSILSFVYLFVFTKKPPTSTYETTNTNQIEILHELFATAPPYPVEKKVKNR